MSDFISIRHRMCVCVRLLSDTKSLTDKTVMQKVFTNVVKIKCYSV